MSGNTHRRATPSAVARLLRQEARFGCAECGNPIVEYHHIIPWEEKQHFEPDHMIALCPTHHTEFGKLPRDKCYSLKKTPFNVKTGKINGYLGGNKTQKALRLGSMRILDCASAINFSGNNIFGYKLVEGEYQLDVFLPDEAFWPEVEISGNHLTASISKFWDIEFKTNWVKFRRGKGDIFLSVDFRGDEVAIDGQFSILGNEISLREKENEFGSNKMSDIEIQGARIGLALGPRGRILKPNYAMRVPKAVLHR